jgi:hypothetical protein
MPYPQIRINKTEEIQKTLDLLKERYRLLSEADIIKLLLSEFYYAQKKAKEARVAGLDSENPRELLFQASRAFGITSSNAEPDNIARKSRPKRK